MADASVLNGLLDAQLTAGRLAKQAHQEFADIENTCLPMVPTLKATAHRNQKKNRYCNVLPFDNNIVELPSIPHRVNPGSQPDHNTYINGSWIRDACLHGDSAPPEMVATQGPLPKTVPEFWRLVALLREPRVIVMLTNVVETNVDKCSRYLPDRRKSLKFEGKNFKGIVEVHEEKVFNQDITYRLLKIRLGKGAPVRPLSQQNNTSKEILFIWQRPWQSRHKHMPLLKLTIFCMRSKFAVMKDVPSLSEGPVRTTPRVCSCAVSCTLQWLIMEG